LSLPTTVQAKAKVRGYRIGLRLSATIVAAELIARRREKGEGRSCFAATELPIDLEDQTVGDVLMGRRRPLRSDRGGDK
jgi:hypothetical protein